MKPTVTPHLRAKITFYCSRAHALNKEKEEEVLPNLDSEKQPTNPSTHFGGNRSSQTGTENNSKDARHGWKWLVGLLLFSAALPCFSTETINFHSASPQKWKKTRRKMDCTVNILKSYCCCPFLAMRPSWEIKATQTLAEMRHCVILENIHGRTVRNLYLP